MTKEDTVTKEMVRAKVQFASGGDTCAAWHYRGTSGACVVMAGGFAVTKEAATDAFASRFHQAGFSVLAFDYRRLGESGGQPRLVLPVRDQIADWHAAISFASTLPEVDAAKIALWGFSASGGHVVRVAAGNPAVAAVIAQTPNADGLAAARNQSRHQRVGAMLRFTGRGALDAMVFAGPAIRAAQRAPRGELVRLAGGHYHPFLAGHEASVEAELGFLRRHLLPQAGESPAPALGRGREHAPGPFG